MFNSGSEHSDNIRSDPHLQDEGSSGGIMRKLKSTFSKLSFRNWRQSDTDLGESSQLSESTVENNMEAGMCETANGSAETSITSTSTTEECANEGPSADCRDSKVNRSNSPAESPTASQGLLNGLLRFGGAAFQRNPNSVINCTCLICLENLTPEEFTSGEAIVLDCQCRGEVAMRHRVCAEKWSRVKGNCICDVCKSPIKNIPEVPPQSNGNVGNNFNDSTLFEEDLIRSNAQILVDSSPTGADVIFDCIRVTWIAMIVSILFFGMDIANALWTGAIVGLGYTFFIRAMYRHQLALILMEQQREREADEGPNTA